MNIHASSRIQTRHSSNQAALDRMSTRTPSKYSWGDKVKEDDWAAFKVCKEEEYTAYKVFVGKQEIKSDQ